MPGVAPAEVRVAEKIGIMAHYIRGYVIIRRSKYESHYTVYMDCALWYYC